MSAKFLAKSAVFSWRLSDDNDDDAACTRRWLVSPFTVPHAGGDSRRRTVTNGVYVYGGASSLVL